MIAAIVAVAIIAKPTPQISGWAVWWNPKSIQSFRDHANQISIVMPEWIVVSANGSVNRRSNVPSDFKSEVKAIARKNGVKVYGMASNYEDTGFDPKRMSLTMATAESRLAHAKAIAKIAREDSLEGIDLDYENMIGSDRENFSLLVEEIAKQLHRDKKRLSVTVHPKQTEPGGWDAVNAQDWKRLGLAADEIRVMTYDNHWDTGEPGSVAENEWVENVIKFATTQVNAKKIWMGVAVYGYDWSTKPARSLTYDDLPADAAWTLDPKSGEMQFGKTWFAGPNSAMFKREIAQKYKLAGMAVWYFGSEKPSTWQVLTGDFE